MYGRKCDVAGTTFKLNGTQQSAYLHHSVVISTSSTYANLTIAL